MEPTALVSSIVNTTITKHRSAPDSLDASIPQEDIELKAGWVLRELCARLVSIVGEVSGHDPCQASDYWHFYPSPR